MASEFELLRLVQDLRNNQGLDVQNLLGFIVVDDVVAFLGSARIPSDRMAFPAGSGGFWNASLTAH